MLNRLACAGPDASRTTVGIGASPDRIASANARRRRIGGPSSASASMASRGPLYSARGHQIASTLHLGGKHSEWRHIVVPLDQGRRVTARKRPAVQVPHDIADRTAVVVDQEAHATAVTVLGETSEVKFADVLH